MDNHVTGRTTARRSRRSARNNREEEANLGQVLRMTPNRDVRETLATATALQRARAAAMKKDREAAIAAEQREARGRYHVSAGHDATNLKFRSNPPVEWTPAEGEVECDTDADEELSGDEEEYTQDEKTNEDEPTWEHDERDAAAIAAAGDADSSLIATPPQDRDLDPTQSDLDFIATDDEKCNDESDPDYYPSTAEDNDEEEEELLTELLQSGNLSRQQSARVKTRLKSLQRSRAIARTLFDANKDINTPGPGEQVASISPPLKGAAASRPTAVAESTRQPPQPSRGSSRDTAESAKIHPVLQEEKEGLSENAEDAEASMTQDPKPAASVPKPTENLVGDPTKGKSANHNVPNDPPEAMPEPRYVPVKEFFHDRAGYERYAAWEKANQDDPRVQRRSIDPEPNFVAANDTDIDRQGFYIYQQWSLRQPDIARDQYDQCHARPGDEWMEDGCVPFYGATKTLPTYTVQAVKLRTNVRCWPPEGLITNARQQNPRSHPTSRRRNEPRTGGLRKAGPSHHMCLQ